MKATVASEITLYPPIQPALDDAVKAALTIDNPEHVQATKQGRWTGEIERKIRGWRHGGGNSLVLPRGFGKQLRQLCANHSARLEVDWSGLADGEPLQTTMQLPLRPYQVEAIEAARQGRQGLLVMPCGGGKTVAAIGAIQRFGCSALVLVDTKDLQAQWRAAVRKFLDMDVGEIGDGKETIEPITVATVQTLRRWDHESLDALGRRFGLAVLDEAHVVPAQSVAWVFGSLPCRYRLGLTATPWRDDGLTPLIEWHCGPTLHEVDRAYLYEHGYLAEVEVRKVATGWTWQTWEDHETKMTAAKKAAKDRGVKPDQDREVKRLQRTRNKLFGAMVKAMVADEPRNAQILQDSQALLAEGRQVVLFSSSVDHCRDLSARLAAMGHRCEALVGPVKGKAREAMLDGFRDGTVRMLCATIQLAAKGLDLPNLNAIQMTTGGRAKTRMVQMIGRGARPCEGLQPVLLDYVDEPGILKGQFYARARAYREAMGQR